MNLVRDIEARKYAIAFLDRLVRDARSTGITDNDPDVLSATETLAAFDPRDLDPARKPSEIDHYPRTASLALKVKIDDARRDFAWHAARRRRTEAAKARLLRTMRATAARVQAAALDS